MPTKSVTCSLTGSTDEDGVDVLNEICPTDYIQHNLLTGKKECVFNNGVCITCTYEPTLGLTFMNV